MAHKLTPEIAGAIIRRMGLVSNSDRGWFEEVLADYQRSGDVDQVIAKYNKEREEIKNDGAQ